ncbi:MAG: Uma2 family endonuclease [Pseudanabaenales cyanobacterium]|nr:Uma2 family endonuclease [Pseudanabaenales cyanobacterium]
MTQANPRQPEIPPAKWSMQRYHEAIEAGIISDWNVELIEGVITPVSPETPQHWYRGNKTAKYLESILGDRAEVRFNSPITLSETERNPDVAIVHPLDTAYEQRHPGPKDIYWLIEVAVSQPPRDLKTKKAVYAKAGIKEYWVIDLKKWELHVFRHPEGEHYTFEEIWDTETITPLEFPDIAIDVERLLSGRK